MFKAFAGNQPYVILFVPIIVVVHVLANFFYSGFPVEHLITNNQLWQINFQFVPIPLSLVLTIIFMSFNALFVNHIFNSNEFFERNTYLPSILYVILASFFPFSVNFNSTLIAQTLLILGLGQLIKVKQNEDAKKQTFNLGFFLGTAISFEPALVFALPFFSLSVLNVRPFVVREQLLLILGVLTPLLWVYVFGKNLHNYQANYTVIIDKSNVDFSVYIGAIILVIIASITSFIGILKRLNKSSIRFRRIIGMLIWIFAYAILAGIACLFIMESFDCFSYLIIVLSFVFPYLYLSSKNKLAANLIYTIFVVASLVKFIW